MTHGLTPPTPSSTHIQGAARLPDDPPSTMKALSKREAKEGLWMVDAPTPEVGPHDLLIRVQHSAICGTDIHIYKWDDWASRTVPVPMVVGHEYMGVVAGMGSEVQGFQVGERVSGEGHITCGHCRNCRAGKRHLCQGGRRQPPRFLCRVRGDSGHERLQAAGQYLRRNRQHL